MNMSLKCSVVMPYYRNRQPLLHTLASLANQSFPASQYEIIIVDDGKSDFELLGLIETARYPINIHYYTYEQNRGSAFARNYGLAKAQGEFVIFLDSDQIVQPDFIAQHMRFFDAAPVDVPLLQIGLRNEISAPVEGQQISVNSTDSRFAVFERYSENMQNLRGGWHLCFSHNFSIRKSILEQLGGFDDTIFHGWGLEDCEFAYKLHKNKVKIAYNPNVLVYHLSHEISWNSMRGFELWNNNLAAFIAKHDDTAVMLQSIFRDFFNPERRQQRIESGDPRPWLTCYCKFENALRSLEDIRSTGEEICIKDINLTNLKGLLEKNMPAQYAVIVNKSNLEVISYVQVCEAGNNIRLFTY
jgi:glycosyltransferase involved in cell wall biosynthesis